MPADAASSAAWGRPVSTASCVVLAGSFVAMTAKSCTAASSGGTVNPCGATSYCKHCVSTAQPVSAGTMPVLGRQPPVSSPQILEVCFGQLYFGHAHFD